MQLHTSTRVVLVGTMLSVLSLGTRAEAPPEWWSEQSVLKPMTSANDYAAANVGQLKALAAKAVDAMNEVLPGGAGPELNELIDHWTEPPEAGEIRHDYAALNQGQLKAVAKLFYDRLAELNYTGSPLVEDQVYPWSEATDDDAAFAVVNLGQLKYLFSFELSSFGDIDSDDDGDGMPDGWEQQYFGYTTVSPEGDFDNDGVSNLAEYLAGTNPTLPEFVGGDSDDDGLPDAWELRYFGTLDYYPEDSFNQMDGTLLDYYEQGRVPYFNPPAISYGLRAWYDADRGGLFNDTYSRIRGLVDLSGNGLHLNQPDPSHQPFLANQPYGGFFAAFAGNEWLFSGMTDITADATDFTVFVVFKPVSAQQNQTTLLSMAAETSSGSGFGLQGYANDRYAYIWRQGLGAAEHGAGATVSILPDDLQLIAFTKNGTLQSAYLNGGLTATSQVSATAPTGFSELMLGGKSMGSFNGQIAEILIYNRALALAERKLIERVMIDRYKLDDSNHNGLPDTWEREYFGELGVDKYDDPDKDGLTNRDEYQLGLDPTDDDTDGDGVADGIEVQIETDPTDPNSYAPLEITWVTRTTYDTVLSGTTFTPDGLLGFLPESTNIYTGLTWIMERNGTGAGDGVFTFNADKDLATDNTWRIDKDFGYVPIQYDTSATFGHWQGYHEGTYAYVHGLPLWYNPGLADLSLRQQYLNAAGGNATFDNSLAWSTTGYFSDDEGVLRTYTDTFLVTLSNLVDPTQLPPEVISTTDPWYVEFPFAYRRPGPDTATSEYYILVPEGASGTVRWFEIFEPAVWSEPKTVEYKQWIIDGPKSPSYTLYASEEGYMTVELIQASLAVDANRDGVIIPASEGISDEVTAEKPFRFWINDDDDQGPATGNDIPDQDSNHADYNNGAVDSVRDLVDFFPVYLDIKDLLEIWPYTTEGTNYRLRQADGALNFVYTDLTRSQAFDYHRQIIETGFGPDFTQAAGSASTQRITAQGFGLSTAFLEQILDGDGGIILVEGRSVSYEPLVLEVTVDGEVVATLSLPLNISSVEAMFRHVDMTGYAKEYDGDDVELPEPAVQTRTTIPPNWPDTETNGKYFVFVHGYNVDTQQARGWQSEIFKRLHAMGSKARFVGVTWHGATGVDYHKAVFQAFQTGDKLKDELAFANNADVTIAAHSLGNMVVSHAIQSGEFTPSRYFMINAAVPIEAYDYADVDADQRLAMTEDSWKDRDREFYAANWHELFANTSNDNRKELTWKSRFSSVLTRAYNFYSPGENVVENPTSSSSNVVWDILKKWSVTRGAWGHQEFVKGTNVFSSGGGSLLFKRVQAGWNWDYDVYTSEPESIDDHLRNELRTKPTFEPFLESALMSSNPVIVSKKVKYDILARALPALSYPVAANRLDALDQFEPVRNINMETEGRGADNLWPLDEHENDAKSVGRWLHSDLKNVALPYIHQMYEKMITIGGL